MLRAFARASIQQKLRWIAMLTIGSGTTEKVKSDISKLGSNLLVVRPGLKINTVGELVKPTPSACNRCDQCRAGLGANGTRMLNQVRFWHEYLSAPR